MVRIFALIVHWCGRNNNRLVLIELRQAIASSLVCKLHIVVMKLNLLVGFRWTETGWRLSLLHTNLQVFLISIFIVHSSIIKSTFFIRKLFFSWVLNTALTRLVRTGWRLWLVQGRAWNWRWSGRFFFFLTCLLRLLRLWHDKHPWKLRCIELVNNLWERFNRFGCTRCHTSSWRLDCFLDRREICHLLMTSSLFSKLLGLLLFVLRWLKVSVRCLAGLSIYSHSKADAL